jgi:hypothetical protein
MHMQPFFGNRGHVNKSVNGAGTCAKNSAIFVMQVMHDMHAASSRAGRERKCAENHPSRERTSGAINRVSSAQAADKRR